MKAPRTKLEHVRAALEHMTEASYHLSAGSADLGTPSEIEDAKAFARAARRVLQELLDREEIKR